MQPSSRSGLSFTPAKTLAASLVSAGLAAGLLQIPITKNLAPSSPLLSRLITWMLAGSFIGLGLGLRWVNVNKARVAHAYIGGLLGGALGGAVFRFTLPVSQEAAA